MLGRVSVENIEQYRNVLLATWMDIVLDQEIYGAARLHKMTWVLLKILVDSSLIHK